MKKIPYWSRVYITRELGIESKFLYAVICENHGIATYTSNYKRAMRLTEQTTTWCLACFKHQTKTRKKAGLLG